MMLHRHFEEEKNKNITTTADFAKNEEFVSNVFPPDNDVTEAPKRRGRPKKIDD
jgi:hypothetical protein